jgi:uncharacterized membrane protein
MAACAKCGATLAEGATFCGSCGTAVGAAAAASAPAGGVPAASGGLTSNVAGALAYIPFVGWIAAIVFLVADPYNKDKFVRFHAFQSLFLHIAFFVLGIVLFIITVVLGVIPIVGWIIDFLLHIVFWIGILALELFLMYKAYSNAKFMLPVVGKIAEQQASK